MTQCCGDYNYNCTSTLPSVTNFGNDGCHPTDPTLSAGPTPPDPQNTDCCLYEYGCTDPLSFNYIT